MKGLKEMVNMIWKDVHKVSEIMYNIYNTNERMG